MRKAEYSKETNQVYTDKLPANVRRFNLNMCLPRDVVFCQGLIITKLKTPTEKRTYFLSIYELNRSFNELTT